MSNQVENLYPPVLNKFFAKYHFFLALLLLYSLPIYHSTH